MLSKSELQDKILFFLLERPQVSTFEIRDHLVDWVIGLLHDAYKEGQKSKEDIHWYGRGKTAK